MNMFKLLVGILICLVSLWGGSYVVYEVKIDWIIFPTVFTSVYGFIGGVFLISKDMV